MYIPLREVTVDSTRLRPWQWAAILAALRPMLRYLNRLQDRACKSGFPGDDPLLPILRKAIDGIHHLTVHVHYAECDAEKRKRDGTFEETFRSQRQKTGRIVYDGPIDPGASQEISDDR